MSNLVSRTISMIMVWLLVTAILGAILVSCAPPVNSNDMTRMTPSEVEIGKLSPLYSARVLNISETVSILVFTDPTTGANCYVAVQSISCVK